MKEDSLDSPRTDDVPDQGPGAERVLRVIHWIRCFNKLMHWVAGVALLGMLALTVADITGRSAFNDPVPGTVEVTALVLVIVVFFGVAHSEDLGDHITVDLIYVRVGKRLKAVMDVVADILSVAVLGLLAFQLWQFAERQQASGAASPVLRWPIWPFVLIAALGSVGYAVAIAMKLVLRSMGEPIEAEDTTGEAGGIEI